VLQKQKNFNDAISAYLEAEELTNKTKNYYLKGLIRENLGIIYCENCNITLEISDNEKKNKLIELQEKYDFEKIKDSKDQLTIKHQRKYT